eukprot:756272-Hanusia_phi.AAC.5
MIGQLKKIFIADQSSIHDVEDENTSSNTTVQGPFHGLKGPKRRWIAYLCWLVGGWAGLHHLYLGDHERAQSMLCSLGHCGIGWLYDGFRVSSLVLAANLRSSGGARCRTIRPLSASTSAQYCKNRVSNTKYGETVAQMCIKFIPLSLYEQLERHTNRYFLFIALLQLDPHLTPTHPATTWGPLAIIFIFTAIRELADDWQRFLADRSANSRQYTVLSAGHESKAALDFKEVDAEMISVGDLVVIRQDQEIPCDIMLLGTSHADGCCFIETSNLDGEADFKLRRTPPVCSSQSLQEIRSMLSDIDCIEVPYDAQHELKGMLWVLSSKTEKELEMMPRNEPRHGYPIGETQSLLQGSQLKNTEWVCGIALYTGNQTRLGRSRRPPACKRSELDGAIDSISAVVFIGQAILAAILGAVGNKWMSSHGEEAWYLRTAMSSEGLSLYGTSVIPLRFLLLMSTLIPLSIQVTMDTCKWLYSMWIGWDLGMSQCDWLGKRDSERGGATLRNSDIAENLGQVGILLSDKTGTMTENLMALKACSINGRIYGEPTTESERRKIQSDPRLLAAIERGEESMVNYMRALALCNTVATVKGDSSNLAVGEDRELVFEKDDVVYEASSPDEEALVSSARDLGFPLLNRSTDTISIRVRGQTEMYRILRELEFTSDRKRMSIVLERIHESGPDSREKLYMFSKGADEVLRPLLASNQVEMSWTCPSL